MNKIYAISRWSIAIIFLYHGVVPKLVFKHEQEVLMNDTMMPFVPEATALAVSGWMEVGLAAAFIILYRHIWLNYVAIFFLVSVTLAILVKLPTLMTYAFNPFSLNLAVVALALINIIAHPKNIAEK